MHSFDGSRFAVGVAACAAALVVLLGATFAVARRLGKHSVVDVAWGLGFVTVALVSLAASAGSGADGRRYLITAMVVVWGSRLAWHIGRRNAGHGEDPRYEAMLGKVPTERRNAYALRMIYGLQGLLVLFISLPVQVAQYDDSYRAGVGKVVETQCGAIAWAGVALWVAGLFFEAVGDWQLKAFKADLANKGTIMDRGLWRYTRHPNYFGDACVWWGIWLVAAETGIGAFTVLSPIVMTLFLTKGSGAALTERRMAGRPGFDEYVARTSAFVPWPPRRA
jgi:steroid 5-alpha reductase family enzyme